MSPRFHRAAPLVFTAALAAFAIAGCGKSSAPTRASNSITSAQATEVAVQIGALVASGSSPAPVPSALLAGGGSGLLAARRPGASAAAAETTVTANGMTWTLSVHWYNALDLEQPGYDPLTTVRMLADSRGSGSLSGPDGSMTLATAGHLDLRGISTLQDTLRTDATENDTLTYSRTNVGGSTTVLSHCSGAFVGVVEAKPVDAHYPARGTATWTMDVARHFTGNNGSFYERFGATAEVRFNGTHLVPLVINGLWQFTLDLDTGQVTPAAS